MAKRTRTHAQDEARSHSNLDDARQHATKKSQYNSQNTRTSLSTTFHKRFGALPHKWQLDVTEAMVLGLDSIVIAGTGAGKTMPFMMPLLLDAKKKVVIISPLKILQEDQVKRFKKMSISAVAVNGETWSSELEKELREGCYQAIFTSPEMCLKHDGFRKILTGNAFEDISALIIDEAHCISQWGGQFHTTYGEIGKLRAFFPSTIPVHAASATLNPEALLEVRSQLGIDADDCFFLNLGNDRPNIAYSVQTINSSTDYDALKNLLTRKPNPTVPDDLIKTIVFVNSVAASQLSAREVRSWFPPELHQYIDYVNAIRSPKSRRRAMRRFEKGETRILFATEAAGMGADIPDIEQVIQFGVPSSLSMWIQRAGRAGCSAIINAQAVLLVEKSVYICKRIKRKKKMAVSADNINGDGDEGETDELEQNIEEAGEEEFEEEERDEEAEEEADVEPEEDRSDDAVFEWGKKVEHALRSWISAVICRRDVVDDHFQNPPNRKKPTHICCDICSPPPAAVVPRVSTPEPPFVSPANPPLTPSKSVNTNGKRVLVNLLGLPHQEAASQDRPVARRRTGALLDAARASLISWRLQKKQSAYSPSSVTATTLISDSIIKTVASSCHITSIDDLRTYTKWIYAERHGNEVLQLLKNIDDADKAQKTAKKAAAFAIRAAATERKREEKEKREAEKEAGREAKRVEVEQRRVAREEKAAQSARSKAEAEQIHLAKHQKLEIAGCSSFTTDSDSTPQAGPVLSFQPLG